jgi:hypothetical protein
MHQDVNHTSRWNEERKLQPVARNLCLSTKAVRELLGAPIGVQGLIGSDVPGRLHVHVTHELFGQRDSPIRVNYGFGEGSVKEYEEVELPLRPQVVNDDLSVVDVDLAPGLV